MKQESQLETRTILHGVYESPIIIKSTPAYPSILEIEVGFDVQGRPLVIFRSFAKKEFFLKTYEDWFAVGTAIINFNRNNEKSEEIIYSETEHLVFKGKFFSSRGTSFYGMMIKNKKTNETMELWKSAITSLTNDFYDDINEKVTNMFNSTIEHDSQDFFAEFLTPIDAQLQQMQLQQQHHQQQQASTSTELKKKRSSNLNIDDLKKKKIKHTTELLKKF